MKPTDCDHGQNDHEYSKDRMREVELAPLALGAKRTPVHTEIVSVTWTAHLLANVGKTSDAPATSPAEPIGVRGGSGSSLPFATRSGSDDRGHIHRRHPGIGCQAQGESVSYSGEMVYCARSSQVKSRT